jgi:hypothetical protein
MWAVPVDNGETIPRASIKYAYACAILWIILG